MRKTVIDQLCSDINEANGHCTYPQRGFFSYANITGDGRTHRTVYVITNDLGGVTAVHNGKNPRETAKNLRAILEAVKVF